MGESRIPDSRNYWLELALFYCSKRETSEKRLRSYFLRKIREYRIPEDQVSDQLHWIDSVLEELVSKKVVDDSRYAGILHRDYQRRGKGKRYIEQKMKERGLDAEIKALEFNPDEELERAMELVEKTRMRASIQKITEPYALRTKLLQKLVASGFDLGISKKAIELVLNPK